MGLGSQGGAHCGSATAGSTQALMGSSSGAMYSGCMQTGGASDGGAESRVQLHAGGFHCCSALILVGAAGDILANEPRCFSAHAFSHEQKRYVAIAPA